MSEKNKVYPTKGFVEIGSIQIHVEFFSEEDEQRTRRVAQSIREKLKKMMYGYNDPINTCVAMLLLQTTLENAELRAKLEYSPDRLAMEKIDKLLNSVEDTVEKI